MLKRNNKGQFVKRVDGEMYDGFGVWYDRKGYACIKVDGKFLKLHVYIWEKINGSKPIGFEIHHKDFNKSNYDYSNLELLSASDHRKVHAGWIRTDGVWTHKPCNKCKQILPLDDFYERKGHTPTACCKKCHCLRTTEYQQTHPEMKRASARKYAQRKYVEKKNNANLR